MGKHIEFESKIVGHGALKIGFGGDFVVEVVECVQPFVVRFNGGGNTEFRCIAADFLKFKPQKLIENGEICPKEISSDDLIPDSFL